MKKRETFRFGSKWKQFDDPGLSLKRRFFEFRHTILTKINKVTETTPGITQEISSRRLQLSTRRVLHQLLVKRWHRHVGQSASFQKAFSAQPTTLIREESSGEIKLNPIRGAGWFRIGILNVLL